MPVSKTYVLAGNATFTVELPESKGHYTFRVQRKEPDGERFKKEVWFVGLLTGPDNTRNYSYLGLLDPFTGQVRTTAKSCRSQDSYPVKLLNRILARIWGDDHEAYQKHGFEVHHLGRCGRCGRDLTVPESVELGIGPECAKLMGLVPEPPRAATAPDKGGEVQGGYVSDGLDPTGLQPHYDQDNDLIYWSGFRNGKPIVIFND